MRYILLLGALLLGGCASQSQQSGINMSDDFDRTSAAKTRISLGLTYLKNGNYSQAKFNLDKALEFDPNLADAHFSIAYYYQLVGESARADSAYREAMDLAPQNADIINSYGAFLCQQGRYPEAKKYFLKAVNSDNYSSTAETYENLALCSQSQGEIDDAIQYMQSAVNHSPTRAKSLYILAEMLASQDMWAQAKDVLRRYERVAPVSAESLWLTAEIEYGLGNYQASRGYGDMLIANYPDHPNTQRYITRHRKLGATPIEPKAKAVVKESSVSPSEAVQVTAQQATTAAPDIEKTDTSEELESESAHNVIGEVNAAEHHVVAKGDNLYRISLQYNVKMKRLIEWNNLPDASAIRVGDKLWVIDPSTIE